MFRPIRMDHTNCLQVAIKTLQFNSRPIRACVVRFFTSHSPALAFFRHSFSKNFHCVTSNLSRDVLASRLRRSINRVHVPPEKTVCACLITLVLVVLRRGSLPGGMYMHSSTTGGMYMHSSTTIFSCLHPTSL
jgi:hypothetical protein